MEKIIKDLFRRMIQISWKMFTLHKKLSFPLRFLQLMRPNSQETVDFVAFTEVVLKEKLHFLYTNSLYVIRLSFYFYLLKNPLHLTNMINSKTIYKNSQRMKKVFLLKSVFSMEKVVRIRFALLQFQLVIGSNRPEEFRNKYSEKLLKISEKAHP